MSTEEIKAVAKQLKDIAWLHGLRAQSTRFTQAEQDSGKFDRDLLIKIGAYHIAYRSYITWGRTKRILYDELHYIDPDGHRWLTDIGLIKNLIASAQNFMEVKES